MTHSADTMRGITLRIASGIAFSLMTALIKLATTLGAGLGEVIFYRAAVGAMVVLLWVMVQEGRDGLVSRRPGRLLQRNLLGVVAMFLSFESLVLLPLAEATTIGFMGPVFATLLSWLVLGERVGWHRWAAAVMAFLGVVVVMRPGSAGHDSIAPIGVMFGLAGAMGTASVTIAVRHMAGTENVGAIAFWFQCTAALAGLVLLPVIGTSPGWTPILILAAAGVLGGFGQIWMTASLHAAPVAALTPFDYLQLIGAVALGWLLLGSVPTAYTWAGAALIGGSGLYTMWRERRRHVSREVPATPPLS